MMRTSSMVHVLGLALVVACSITWAASKNIAIKNLVTSGKNVFGTCSVNPYPVPNASDVFVTVKPGQQGNIDIVSNPKWVCFGQIGDLAEIASQLYDDGHDQDVVINTLLVEARDGGFRRFNELTKKWESLPNLN